MASTVRGDPCRRDTTDAGSHGVGKKQATKRLKRWATRARTGCLTCRARHIRCDEGKPACSRCTKGGRQCRGYTADAGPSDRPLLSSQTQVSASGNLAILPVWLRRGMPQPRHNVEPEPPHWELIEATRYFFEYVQPLIKGQALPKTVRVPAWNGSSGWSLLMRVSTHRLNATHRILGRMATEDEDPSTSGAWATYSRQMAYLLRLVNEGINGDMGCQSNKELLLRRIYNLVFHDLAVDASAWRLHMIGYLALVQQLGGVRALMQDSTHHLTLTQWGMLNMGIGYNTTSPASMQLRGFEAYTYEDIAKLANVLGTQTFRTPASLLTATQNISQLRSHEADNTYTDPAMKMAVRDVFNRIVAFDGAKWAVDMKYKEVEKITVGAHILQEAILLYAILSLPRSAVVSWSEAAGSRERSGSQTSAFGRLLTVHRRRLLDLLRPYQGSFESRLDLNWPLVVAGVSLGGDGSSVNDRGFVADSILGIWRNPITRCSPLVCLGKLRAFWESGKTAWDDCFYEPTPCLG